MGLNLERFRQLRELHGWNKREMARLCGFNELQIHRYEAGINDPSSENLKVIARIFSVSTDYLLGLTDEPRGHYVNENTDENEQDILNAYRRHGWAGIVRLGADRLIEKDVYTLDRDAEPDINEPR